MTTALASGGRQFFGWGQDRSLAADLYDALNINTVATGNWKGKPPKLPSFPRPKRKAKPKPNGPTKPVGLKQIHAQFMGAFAARTQGK